MNRVSLIRGLCEMTRFTVGVRHHCLCRGMAEKMCTRSWRTPSLPLAVRHCSKGPKLKDIRLQEAKEFLANMDEEMVEKHKIILSEIDMLRQQALPVPEEIDAYQLFILLTEHKSMTGRENYLRYLYLTELGKSTAESNRISKRQHKSMVEPRTSLEQYSAFSVPIAARKTFLQKMGGVNAYTHGQPFIIDLSYDVKYREQVQARTQFNLCYGINARHPEGFHLHLTGINKNVDLNRELKHGLLDTYLLDFHEEPFWELFPLDKLVYLSPNAPKLNKYNPDDIYIMGGLVDLHDTSPVSLARAKELGIRAHSLPLMDYCALGRKTTLTLNAVLSIMLDMNLHQNWHTAMSRNLPSRMLKTTYQPSRQVDGGDGGHDLERDIYSRSNRDTGLNRDSAQPGFDRNSRGPGFDRDSRGPGFDRNSRGPGFDRNSRGPDFDRDSRGPSFDRNSRGPSFDRNSRVPSFDRNSRVPSFDRDSRGPSFDRDGRDPGYFRRYRRGSNYSKGVKQLGWNKDGWNKDTKHKV